MIKKLDIIIIISIILLSAVLWLFAASGDGAPVAVIEVNGREYRRIPLSSLTLGEERVIIVESEGQSCEVAVTAKGVRFLRSDCANGLCVRRGNIVHTGDTAVCLPLRVAIRIEGAGGLDGVTG